MLFAMKYELGSEVGKNVSCLIQDSVWRDGPWIFLYVNVLPPCTMYCIRTFMSRILASSDSSRRKTNVFNTWEHRNWDLHERHENYRGGHEHTFFQVRENLGLIPLSKIRKFLNLLCTNQSEIITICYNCEEKMYIFLDLLLLASLLQLKSFLGTLKRKIFDYRTIEYRVGQCEKLSDYQSKVSICRSHEELPIDCPEMELVNVHFYWEFWA